MKTGSDSSAFIVSVLLVLVALAASLTFPPIQQIRDSLYWVKEVEQGTNLYALLNPHHLVYLPAVRALYATLGKVCASCGPIHAAQAIGLASSAIAVVALFYLARRLAASTFVAAGLALALVFSRTYWVFSMQVSPYVPLLAALALFALTIVTRGEHLQDDKWGMLAVAGTFATAVLLHQAAILIGFALTAYLFASRSWRDAWRALLWIAICSGGIVLIAYLAAFVAIFGVESMSFPALLKYLTRYASTNTPGVATFANFSLEGLTTLLDGHFETFMSPPWALRLPILFAFGTGLLLLIGWNVFRSVSGDRLGVRLFFVSWLTIMLGFLLWAYPMGGVPPTLNVVPILALVSLAAGDFLRLARSRPATVLYVAAGAPILFLAVMFAVRNFDDAIGPLHSSLGKKYEKASLLAAAAPKRCTIVEGDQEVLMNLYYHFDRGGLDAWDLMTWFYFGKENKLPFTWANFRFSDHDCLVVEAKYLSPTMPVQQHVADQSALDRWYAYIEWLLGFGYESGRVASTRCMNSVVDSRGSRYLIINLRERCDAAGFEAVVGQLDALLGASDGQRGVAVFSDWFAQHREAVRGFRQRPFRDILSDVGPWRARPLAS
jgi:hypothetical protein